MSPETRAFLEAVRAAEDPTPEDEARVLGAVRAAVAAGAGAGLVAGAAKSSKLLGVSGLSGLKLGGVVVGLAAGVWLAGAAVSKRAEPAAPAVKPLRSAATAAPSVPRVPPPAEADSRPTVFPAPVAGSSMAAGASAPSGRPRPPASLRREIALLADVERALEGGDGAGALRLLEGHVTSDRQLEAEREAARVHALCALGRTREARELAARFARAHPDSVQRPAVERACAGPDGGR